MCHLKELQNPLSQYHQIYTQSVRKTLRRVKRGTTMTICATMTTKTQKLKLTAFNFIPQESRSDAGAAVISIDNIDIIISICYNKMHVVRCKMPTVVVKCDFVFLSQEKVKKTLKEIARSLSEPTINAKVRQDWTEIKINL